MTFSYDPTQIRKYGKDQMRFELGDTSVEGGATTCALSDEEYTAMLEGIAHGKRAWLGAKLNILEAILLKLSYQVNTKIDVLTYGLGDRAEHWKALYEMLRKEWLANSCVPSMADSAARKHPYFHTDMMPNRRAQLAGQKGNAFPFHNMGD
ncbi:MAG: hypothetical protein FWB91_00140 [Defluviitaleaceae bacterium]|nr:hypothetical protein [Defluviitaleaceae bacterium]